MGFISITEESTKVYATNVRLELQSKSIDSISHIDPFLLQDLSIAIEQGYRLQIVSNRDGRGATYKLKDALINTDALDSVMMLPLKLEVEINDNIQTHDFNISRIDPDTSYGSFENPKYYIYCDNSNEIGFRFWFFKNEQS